MSDEDFVTVTIEPGCIQSGVGSSVVVFEGTLDDGTRVQFGADHRNAAEMADLVFADGELVCAVESWQIIRVVTG